MKHSVVIRTVMGMLTAVAMSGCPSTNPNDYSSPLSPGTDSSTSTAATGSETAAGTGAPASTATSTDSTIPSTGSSATTGSTTGTRTTGAGATGTRTATGASTGTRTAGTGASTGTRTTTGASTGTGQASATDVTSATLTVTATGSTLPPATGGVGTTDCTHKGSGRDFPVGPGQKYARVGDVPWYDLGPGDTVRIFWQAEPYREQILLSNRGSAGQPIRVCGVAGPNGERPVLSGQNATTGPNLHFISYDPIQDSGVILINRDAGDDYYSRPGYISIEGLAVRGGYEGYRHTVTSGTTRAWGKGSAAIAIIGGDHIDLRNCEISDSGNGLFTLSKDEAESTLVSDLLVEGCEIFGNGNVGSDREHNVYAQTIGVTFQFNRFGRLRPGAGGANQKDRSAGTVVRYNRIEGSVRQLDLVDAQEHTQTAQADPRYRQTFVYGNLIESGPDDAALLIHYGGDTQGYEQNFRKGTLYFYNNTVILKADSGDLWNTMLFNVSTNDEHVDMRNNVIWKSGTTNFSLMNTAGHLEMANNWIGDKYTNGRDGFTGTVTGTSGLITGSNPGLDADGRPVAGSPIVDKGGALASGLGPVEYEYMANAKGTPRVIKGALDLGAFEAK